MYPMSLWLSGEDDLRAVAGYVASLPPARPQPVLSGGSAERGRVLFKTCAACHGPDGAGKPAVHAPRLAGGSDWYLLSALQKFKAGVRGADPRNPNGAIMRAMASSLPTEQAMKDVIAYIMTLDR